MHYLIIWSLVVVSSLSGGQRVVVQDSEFKAYTSPACILENMTPEERNNAIIQLEYDERGRNEAEIIEALWNSGKYDEAITLMKNSQQLQDVGIGIAWKTPIKTSVKWGDDVLISSYDSVQVVDMDIDNATGNLFAVIVFPSGTYTNWTVNISSDTGRTWSQTYIWGSNAVLADCAVLGNFLYIAYTTTGGLGRIRRFNTSDGSVDTGYGFHTVINEGTDLRDIVLTSDADHSIPHYLLYFAIMDNDSLRLYWSDTAATTWTTFNPPVGNASRGLDACVTSISTSPYRIMWASFIGTDNKIYTVGGWSTWNVYGPHDTTGTSSSLVTSIGAYGDTVIVVFPQTLSSDSNYVKYRIRYTEGGTWLYGYLYGPSTSSSYVNDVTARLGDGIGVIYQTSGSSAGAYYRHRSYANPSWSSPINVADSIARYNVKPSIERVGSEIYGILYVNYPEQVVLFDRSDWVVGIGEDEEENTGLHLSTIGPGIFNGQVALTYSLPINQRISLDVYDFSGRHVKTLVKGPKEAGKHSVVWRGDREDGRAAPSGIYFCVLVTDRSRKVMKLVLVR